MSRIKKFWAAITAALVGVTAAVVIATPAQAAFYDCPQTYNGVKIVGCMWEHTEAQGARFHVTDVLGCRNMPYGWANVVSSYKDHTRDVSSTGYFRVWTQPNCSGSSWTVESDYGNSGTFNFGWPPNDSVDSYAVYRY